MFAHYYRLLEHGETGMIPESAIEPLDMESLADVDGADETAAAAIGKTAVIKLNGGLGTSMGMDRAKSLLCVRRGPVLPRHHRAAGPARPQGVRRRPAADLHEQLPHLGRHDGRAGALLRPAPSTACRWSSCRTRSPSSLAKDLAPVGCPKDPDLEWCPPGHGDIYTALRGTGLLDKLIDAGYTQVFVSNSDNLGAVPDARVAGWFADRGAPFAIEAVRRTPSDRKGGHFARRKSDGRIVLRESAQTLDRGQGRARRPRSAQVHLDQQPLVRPAGDEGRARRARRRPRPADDPQRQAPRPGRLVHARRSIQIETAMGAAIEVFADSRTIEVGRDRFVPVKTTNDLLVLRSDVYDLGKDFVLDQVADDMPFVELDPDHYKLVGDFDKRFPEGAPSLEEASSLRSRVTGRSVPACQVVGEVDARPRRVGAARSRPGTVLDGVGWPDTDRPPVADLRRRDPRPSARSTSRSTSR